MKNDKFVFLILHYQVFKETKKCIDSILEKYSSKNIQIVVVDNGSTNNSGEKLKTIYTSNEKIHFVISKENLGFANGNNLGIKYIIKNLEYDFIVMTNNDIVFTQEDFIDKILEKYSIDNFAVIGPKIINPENNPYYHKFNLRSYKTQIMFIIYLYVVYFFTFFHMGNFVKRISKLKMKRRGKIQNYDDERKNVVLHGSCLIFSKKYFEIYKDIDNRTFLYCEEELLYVRIVKSKLTSIYYPYCEVFHNHGVATNTVSKNKVKKDLFVLKNQIKSNKILLHEIKEL